MTGRPGTGLGAGPRGGCWFPPAAAMAARPAWRSASASSLLKNTKICMIQCCGSGMDKRERLKKLVVMPFYVATNFTEL